MAKWYDLMDFESNNMVGSYESEDGALRDVLDALTRHGSVAVATLALLWGNEAGEGELIAEGEGLAKLAISRLARAKRRSA